MLQTPEEIEKYFPGFLAFIDSTIEQPMPRPIDNKRRKSFYSGKKKRHTVKNQIVVNSKGHIIYKLGHKKGRRYDYDIYKKNRPVLPKEVVNVFDLAYLGVKKDFPEQKSSIPIRKQRNQDLSQEEIDYNRIHSRKRVVIEHAICRLKKYRIMSDVFRNKLRKHNNVSDIVIGLINYRIMTP